VIATTITAEGTSESGSTRAVTDTVRGSEKGLNGGLRSVWRELARDIVARRPVVALPEKQTGRGSAGAGIAPRGLPGLLKAFRKAARVRLRRIRIVRLSRTAWGAPDAHLQTTLNLFDQPGSRAATGTRNNSRPSYSHRVEENSRSLGL